MGLTRKSTLVTDLKGRGVIVDKQCYKASNLLKILVHNPYFCFRLNKWLKISNNQKININVNIGEPFKNCHFIS